MYCVVLRCVVLRKCKRWINLLPTCRRKECKCTFVFLFSLKIIFNRPKWKNRLNAFIVNHFWLNRFTWVAQNSPLRLLIPTKYTELWRLKVNLPPLPLYLDLHTQRPKRGTYFQKSSTRYFGKIDIFPFPLVLQGMCSHQKIWISSRE